MRFGPFPTASTRCDRRDTVPQTTSARVEGVLVFAETLVDRRG